MKRYSEKKTNMRRLVSTGEAARLLGVTEPQLADAVRRGKVRPEPPVFAGRRVWERAHLLSAAQHFDRPLDRLEADAACTAPEAMP